MSDYSAANVFGVRIHVLNCLNAKADAVLFRNSAIIEALQEVAKQSRLTDVHLFVQVDELGLEMDKPPSLGVFEQAIQCVKYLRERFPPDLHHPSVGIICGSGLGDLAKAVLPGIQAEIDYQDIPHFPRSTGTYWITLIGFYCQV